MTTLQIILAVIGVGVVLSFLAWALVRGGQKSDTRHASPEAVQESHGPYTAPCNQISPPPPPSPEPTPELSCLAIGLIRSFEMEPEKWEYASGHLSGESIIQVYRQADCDYDIEISPDDSGWIYAEGIVTAHDQKAVLAAFRQHVIEAAEIRVKQAADEKSAKRRAHFERLAHPSR